jgi:fatty-acyl-CoA synthase
MTPSDPSAFGRFGSSDKNSSNPKRFSLAKAWLKTIEASSRIERGSGRSLDQAVQERACRHPDRPALLSDDGYFTYGEIVNRV